MRSTKQILVTGGAGFIGKNFILHLLKNTKSLVVNLDALTYAGSFEYLPEINRLINVHGNILNEKLILHLIEEHEIDTIVHFAAESHVDNSIENPKLFLETNILGTQTLLETVRKYPHIHFHHVSTDEVFGALGKTGSFNEKSPYNPQSPYSASKASSDHLVRAYANTYKLSTTISNCSNNFGPHQHQEKLIPKAITKTLLNEPIPLYGDGTHVRDWLFVEDHCEALLKILKQGKTGETYLVGGDTEISNKDLVEQIVAQISLTTKKPLQPLITFIEDRKGHDFRYAIDASKIKNELYWFPKTSLEEGLRKTINWFVHLVKERSAN